MGVKVPGVETESCNGSDGGRVISGWVENTGCATPTEGLRRAAHTCRRTREIRMRILKSGELTAVGGGASSRLTTISVTSNPGGVVNKSADNNPNAITTTITFKTTGKPA